MNKQEIIDKLRLEISDRDMLLIDMQARLKIGVKSLQKILDMVKKYPEHLGTATANCFRLITEDAIKDMTK